jgi:hypothetical protein
MVIVLNWVKIPKFFWGLIEHLHGLCRLEKHKYDVTGNENVSVLVEELPHMTIRAAA